MQIGLIGLGAMGSGMAAQLHKSGMLRCVWNRTQSRADDFNEKYPVMISKNPAELAAQCDVIITCVSADKDIVEVINAIKPNLRAGQVIVDTSTISTTTARMLAKQLSVLGVAFLDAPVSGGVEGAQLGQLVMMVGGEQSALQKVTPVLNKIARKICWMGESGAGQATKAVNQIMAAGINQAVTESLAFAEAMQLPLEQVVDVISDGAAANWFLTHRGKNMVNREYEPGFKIALHKKDLDLCREMAESVSALDMRLPIVEMTRIHYERLQEQGYGDEDISALHRLKRDLFE